MNPAYKTRRALPVLNGAVAASELRGAAPASQEVGPAGVRIGVVTLGCDKNTVDSERILAQLASAGVRASAGAIKDADIILVNTCGFIDAAKEESVEAILDAVRLKESGRVRTVVAMGCLVQRYHAELRAELPEVDLFLGLSEAERLVPELEARGLLPGRPTGIPLMERPLRLLATATPHTSYLKISEGCDHGCAFCAIPLMRGRHRSVPLERLIAEARELEARGVVELNLVSQDTTWYGRDWRSGVPAQDAQDGFYVGMLRPPTRPADGERGAGGQEGTGGRDALSPRLPVPQWNGDGKRVTLPGLLCTLLQRTGIPWFRLFYMYPSGISRGLVELIAREERILPYLDMPIQHGSDAVLRRMRRPERRATIQERVRWLRQDIPDVALRSTVIVGFPGETEDDFEMLLELLEELRFDHLGAFSYSVEEGTPAATMPEQVPEEVKRERLERLLDIQRAISLEKNEARVGRETTVLVDQRDTSRGSGVGRTRGQALEIDGVIYLTGAARRRPGDLVRARVTGAQERDLVGEVLGP